MKIAIVGAGLMGRVLALTCLQQGCQVTLFDADQKSGHASAGLAAAGMCAVHTELESTDAIMQKIGLNSLRLWKTLLAELHGPAVFFQQHGSLAISHQQDQNELAHFRKQILHKLDDPDDLQTLDRKQLLAMEPDLDFPQALYFPKDAQIASEDLFPALATTLEEQGALWHDATPIDHPQPNTIHYEQQKLTFDHVFDCRGLGAQTAIKNLRAVRGELIWLHCNDVHISRPVRLLHPRYKIYLTPRPHQRYLVGASSIESDDMSPISVQSTLELLSAAYSIHPGFAEARILKTVVNCRPALPDHLPRIDYQPGLTRINGLYRYGYVLAPTLAVLALQQVLSPSTPQPYPMLFGDLS